MHHDAASNLPGTVEKIIKPIIQGEAEKVQIAIQTGTVEKIIKPIIQGEAEKVQIAIQSGDDRNQKIRIANILVDAQGEAVSLKQGAAVHIVVRPKPKDPIQ